MTLKNPWKQTSNGNKVILNVILMYSYTLFVRVFLVLTLWKYGNLIYQHHVINHFDCTYESKNQKHHYQGQKDKTHRHTHSTRKQLKYENENTEKGKGESQSRNMKFY